jgi:hypothetical protein
LPPASTSNRIAAGCWCDRAWDEIRVKSLVGCAAGIGVTVDREGNISLPDIGA